MSPTTPKPVSSARVYVRRGLTLVEIILGLVVGALLVFAAFVSFQNVFNKTREHAELAALKSVAREAQALLAISGADRWDTQAGLDAVMDALEDWPPAQAAGVVGVVADDSDLVVTEADVWPGISELTFTRSPNTLLMVVSLDDGACVVAAPLHSGTIQGGCVSNLTDVGGISPSEAVTHQQIPGINNTTALPEQPASTTTTTEPEPEPDPGFWAQTSAGADHTCGLTTDGEAYCWGYNNRGQLGNGNTNNQNTPAKVSGNHRFVEITAGSNHSCALIAAGDVYCWGYNPYGQLGNGNTNQQTTPVKVSSNHSFVSITAGYLHTCGLTTDGDAYCWGYGGNGQLGIGNTADQATPVKVAGNHSFVSITAGYFHTCGLTTDGDVYCWGQGGSGRLGNGNTTNQTTPVKVSGNHSYASISAGSSHSCALNTDGDAYCWGWNAEGQLGNGTTNAFFGQTTPVKVSGNHSFVSITAGNSYTCGLTTDGDVYCWGQGGSGRLGNGNTTNQTTPVKVSGNHSYASISAGSSHSCALNTDGDAYCWGYGGNGQLGNGSTANQLIPVLVVEP